MRPSGSTQLSSASGTSGSRKATLRCTGPGRPGSIATATARAIDAAPVAHLAHARLGHREVVLPAHGAVEEARLVDGLARAGVAQLGGAVGGERDDRHTGVRRLDHRGREVGHGGAARGDDDDRLAADLREAERDEAGAALVDADVQAQVAARVGLGERDRERRAAAAGREHHLGDAAAHQLVDDHPRHRGRRVHRRTLSR